MAKTKENGFELFRASPAAKLVRRMIGLDIGAMASWGEMSAAFGRRMDDRGWERVSSAFHVASSGEACAMAAILSSMDYHTLADRLLAERNVTFLDLLRPTTGPFRTAVALAIMLNEVPQAWRAGRETSAPARPATDLGKGAAR
ncbi:hypothetical protein [Methylopila sp. Yamaguchi]|uniref:hypothetical protein n=1 Tax=Methylopila sp. Yamaguchi TaxID=1437817 RepID=UPI000CA8638F|nr:hypothetical protein [Methylopila sp. Yamaguchi]GBD46852.1 hypothetical protein METY_0065 [Methylopila sp. Yamaguchi]